MKKEPSYGIMEKSHRRNFLWEVDTDTSRNTKNPWWDQNANNDPSLANRTAKTIPILIEKDFES